MRLINEDLRKGDLKNLVRSVFEIDSYKSKMGDDKDIVVVSFTVKTKEPAQDLVDFIERGYSFVLDADISTGELADGAYKVFVEIERNKKIGEQIVEMLGGIERLTNINEFRFRYYKSFASYPATLENLKEIVPGNKDEYERRLKEESLHNFSNFFNRSYLEAIEANQNTLEFRKKYAEPLRLRITGAGRTDDVYKLTEGKISNEYESISEVVFLTKYIGDYNITKVGNHFIFENNGFAVRFTKPKKHSW